MVDLTRLYSTKQYHKWSTTTYNSVWDRNGGGGGAGAYVEYSVQRSALIGNLNITVGGGGAGGAGSSGGSSGGGNGNSSHLTINGVNVVGMSGGVGGYVAANNNPCTVANAQEVSQSNGSSGGTITSGGYGGISVERCWLQITLDTDQRTKQ